MSETMKREASREANGQYAEGLDRVCAKCGETKGEHLAERPWTLEEKDCDGFKAVRQK